ncbi:MAG: hypothetical protein JWN24_426 [Phycisphaerales bacterium]|nr:hypothetical protein [Phycisphaerales bacterium]
MDARENTSAEADPTANGGLAGRAQLDVRPLTLTLSPEYEGEGTNPSHVSRFTFHSCLSKVRRQRRTPRVSRAFTLAEMSISLFVIGVIVVTVGSSVTLVLRAAQNNRDPLLSGVASGASATAQACVARSAVDTLAADLKVATGIINTPGASGAFTLTLTVPDRTGDSQPETLVYAWGGAGTALTRKQNASAAVSIADNVQSLNLVTTTKTVGTAPSGAGSDTLLASHDGGSGTNVALYALTSNSWPCQYVMPTLPAKAQSWGITRVFLQLARNGAATGTLTVKVLSTNASQQPLTLLASASVDVTTMGAGPWINVPLTGISGLSPGTGVCITVSSTAATPPGFPSYDSSAYGSGMSFCTTANAAASWSTPLTTSALQFQLYGSVTLGP